MARGKSSWIYLFSSRLPLALFVALVAVSCISAEDSSGGASSGHEAPGITEQAIICPCGTCTATTCADMACGAGRDECCIPRPKNDGAKCVNGTATGTCAGGECCLGCIQELKGGVLACQPGDQPVACGAPGGTCASCSDNNPCTEDVCDPRGSGRCSWVPLTDETACPSGICWGGECCKGCIDEAGVCHPGNLPDACGLGGARCAPCIDDNSCTDDVCNAGTCGNPNRPNGASCETDSNVCNGTSTCQVGKCTAGPMLNCDDGNPCTNDMCDPVEGCRAVNNTLGCSDGNPCTSGDACSGGSCRAGAQVVCNDNEVCTTDSCNPARGCEYLPRGNGITCDDGSACTLSSTCTGGKCVGGQGELICDDMNPCTKNGCSPLIGVNTCNYAVLEPPNTPCVGANKCLVNTFCDPQGTCAGGVQKDCNDNNPCTSDSCTPATGACVNTPLNTGACNDGSICTLNDSCRAGQCTGDVVDCAPLDDCHVAGTCNQVTGVCDDPRAEDGTACAADTGTCTGGRCVTNPIPPSDGGAGGADSTGEGGDSTSSGGTGETGDAGAGATSGVVGSGGTSAGGTAAGRAGQGGRDEAERGPTFSRKPGGCDCSIPRNGSSSNALLLFAISALAVAHGRRRRRTELSS